MKRVLYLDIDGVLNGILESISSFDKSNIDIKEFILHSNYFLPGDFINSYKLKLLQELTNNNNIEVVNISSWDSSIKNKSSKLAKFLNLNITRTADKKRSRDLSILEDVIENKVDCFVILDDGLEIYQDHPNHLFYNKNKYWSIFNAIVSPHGRYGLNESDIEKCSQIFGLSFFEYITVFENKYFI